MTELLRRHIDLMNSFFFVLINKTSWETLNKKISILQIFKFIQNPHVNTNCNLKCIFQYNQIYLFYLCHTERLLHCQIALQKRLIVFFEWQARNCCFFSIIIVVLQDAFRIFDITRDEFVSQDYEKET